MFAEIGVERVITDGDVETNFCGEDFWGVLNAEPAAGDEKEWIGRGDKYHPDSEAETSSVTKSAEMY